MRRLILKFSALFMFFVVATSFAQSPPSNDPAQYYERGMNALRGAGVSHNTQDAVQLLHTSAEMGYLPAQTVVGYFYDTGDIVAREPSMAADWYGKAAAQDDPLAEWLLGRLYLAGGLQRDLNQAALTLQKSAQQGNPFAEYLLGEVRLEQQNYSDAAKSFRDAAQQGIPHAQQELGVLLEKGQGVPQDKFEAYVWLLVSLDAGNNAAATDLSLLEGDLGSTQVEKAKSQARDLESTASRSVVAHGCTGWSGEFDVIPSPPPPDLQRFCR
jgi:TPR repeat protein